MSESRKRIALVHPEIKGGGGESVLAWTIQALMDNYSVTVITTDEINLNFINSFYKTNLQKGQFGFCRVFPLAALSPRRLYVLKRHLIMRYCKSISRQFDIFFSTQNEMDFGVRGIQYIHFPVHADNSILEVNTTSRDWHQRDSQIHTIYRRASIAVSDFREQGIRRNITVVNSNWTKELVKKAYNIESNVVFPPVLSDISPRPWKERENGFVCVGWIRPEKQIDKVIEIVSLVRRKGFDIDLHIIGPVWDKAYSNKLLTTFAHNNNWLHFEGALDRIALSNIIGQHRFGIHGYQNEHFGVAVAEAAKAGCIVFVPDGGGQREIVDFNYRVIYQNEKDAVEKIIKILRDQHAQEEISQEMMLRGARFSSGRFVEQIRKLVNNNI